MARASKHDYKQSPVRHLEEDIFNEAVQGRGGGHWAGTFFGLGYGLLAGAAIGVVPGFFADGGFSALTWQGVAGSSAALGTLGALQGRAAGSDNGSAAGAAVGSTKVLLTEMRQQFAGIKKEIGEIKDRAGMPHSEDAPQTPAEEAATQNRGGYLKWKTAITGALLGAIVGVVAFAAAAFTGLDMVGDVLGKLGFGGGNAALGAGLLGGASGAFFGFNVPLITAKMHMVGRQAINQRIFERDETPARAQEVSVQQEAELPPCCAAKSVSYAEQVMLQRTQETTHHLSI